MNTLTSIITLDGTQVSGEKVHFFALFDMVTFELENPLAAGSHTVIITNIQNPIASSPVPPTMIVRTVNARVITEKATFNMPTNTPGGYNGLDYVIEPTTLNCPYASYTFQFNLSKNVPQGAQILITFPTPDYSFPAFTYCHTIIGLTGKKLN